MVQLIQRRWLVGLTVLVTLAQGPAMSWAAHGHGGGGGAHFGGGGHMGGGFSGGHMGGAHFGGGSFGGSHFSAPSHSFSMPSHSFRAPTQHFSAPTHSFQAPRSLPSTQFHSPGLQNVQPHLGTHSIPQFQPGHTATHNTWSLPTHNGVNQIPGLQHNGSGITPRSVTTFGQHPAHATPSQGILNGNGHNPYLTGTHHTPGSIGGLANGHGNNLPGVTSNHHLPSLGGAGGIGHHTTLKPTIGANNPFGNHPHIGGHQPSVINTALNHAGAGKNGFHQATHNLPQFQSAHHGNHGNWGLGGQNHHNGIGSVNGGNWNNAWRNNSVHHHHHNWYYGAWGGSWGFGYYAPFYWGARYWGLGGYYSPWGYGGYGGYGSYYNPYCVTLIQPAYASLPVTYYSQPVALPQQPVSDADDAGNTAAYALVDAARTDFRNGDYQAALTKLDQAIPQLPNDTVVHELRGVTLFALGEYSPAAATLNALLAVAPGMDWATLRGLYPDAQTYEAQLRRLEDATRADQKDPALRFVLAYFYMVTNYPEAATAQLKKVVELEPKDVVAKKLLDSLTQTNEPPAPAAGTEAAGTVPDTDLVGRWRASANGSQFELTLNDGLQFDWQVTPANGAMVKQTGRYTATNDRLILESAGQETLVAKVQSLGVNRFQLWVNDKDALVFERQTASVVAQPTPIDQSTPSLIPAPPPVGVPAVPTPLSPVIGADGLPLVPSPLDATKPENLGPVLP